MRIRWGWRVFALFVAIAGLAFALGSKLLAGAAGVAFGLVIVAFTVDGLRRDSSTATDPRARVRDRHPGTFWFLIVLYFGFGILIAFAGLRMMLTV